MDVSDIAMLEAIVEHGSINKASEALHVTQPTLSKRLGRLEQKLGTQLFLRSASGLTPTAATHFIIDSSTPIKTMLGNIERHIELMNVLEGGDLNLGVGPIVEQLYFPQVLHQLTQSASSTLNLTIRTEAAPDLKKLVLSGAVDIAVGPFQESDDNEGCVVQPIASQPLTYAARDDHPLVQEVRDGKELTPERLSVFPLIAPHIPKYIETRAPVFGQAGVARIVCDNYSVIKDFLKRSDHISAGPVGVFSPDVEEGSLAMLPLLRPIDWHAACVVRPESAPLPMIRSVIEIFARHKLPSAG